MQFFNQSLDILIYICCFIIGVSFGSFLNVLIYRIHNKLDWFKQRSFCIYCNKTLFWYDLIPLLSFVNLKGKCRFCKGNIPISYFIIEFISGIIFVTSYFFLSNDIILFLIVSFSLLFFLGLFVSDLKYLEFPSFFLYLLIFLGIIYNFAISFNNSFFNTLLFFSSKEFWLSILIPFLFFGLQYVLTGGQGIGDGDIWLGVIMGLFVGFPLIIYSILISYFTATAIYLPLLLMKKVNRKTAVPLGVFLVPSVVCFFVSKVFFNFDFYVIFINPFFLSF